MEFSFEIYLIIAHFSTDLSYLRSPDIYNIVSLDSLETVLSYQNKMPKCLESPLCIISFLRWFDETIRMNLKKLFQFFYFSVLSTTN